MEEMDVRLLKIDDDDDDEKVKGNVSDVLICAVAPDHVAMQRSSMQQLH